jgi:hypothetical protein
MKDIENIKHEYDKYQRLNRLCDTLAVTQTDAFRLHKFHDYQKVNKLGHMQMEHDFSMPENLDEEASIEPLPKSKFIN